MGGGGGLVWISGLRRLWVTRRGHPWVFFSTQQRWSLKPFCIESTTDHSSVWPNDGCWKHGVDPGDSALVLQCSDGASKRDSTTIVTCQCCELQPVFTEALAARAALPLRLRIGNGSSSRGRHATRLRPQGRPHMLRGTLFLPTSDDQQVRLLLSFRPCRNHPTSAAGDHEGLAI